MRMRRKSASVIAMFAMLMAVMIPQAGAFAGDDGETEDDENAESPDEADPDDGEDEAGSDETEGSGDDEEADDGAEEAPIEGSEDEALEDEGAFQTQTLDSEPVEIQSGSDNHCPEHNGHAGKVEKGQSPKTLGGLDVLVTISGKSVTFSKDVEFCVKASTDATGKLSGTTYDTSVGEPKLYTSNGKNHPDISYVVVYSVNQPVCDTTIGTDTSKLAYSWAGNDTVTLNIKDGLIPCDDVKLWLSSYDIPDTWDGGNHNPSLFPQDHRDSKYFFFPKNQVPQAQTNTVELPDECVSAQIDLYWGPDKIGDPVLSYPGHGSVYISHRFQRAAECPEPETTEFEVKKLVTGQNTPSSNTEFDFSYDCGEDQAGEFALKHGQSRLIEVEYLGDLPTCTITETQDNGAAEVSNTRQVGDDGHEAEFQLEPSSTKNKVTFTNRFERPVFDAKFRIQKLVAGNGDAPEGKFEFEWRCGEESGTVYLADGETEQVAFPTTSTSLIACSVTETDTLGADGVSNSALGIGKTGYFLTSKVSNPRVTFTNRFDKAPEVNATNDCVGIDVLIETNDSLVLWRIRDGEGNTVFGPKLVDKDQTIEQFLDWDGAPYQIQTKAGLLSPWKDLGDEIEWTQPSDCLEIDASSICVAGLTTNRFGIITGGEVIFEVHGSGGYDGQTIAFNHRPAGSLAVQSGTVGSGESVLASSEVGLLGLVYVRIDGGTIHDRITLKSYTDCTPSVTLEKEWDGLSDEQLEAFGVTVTFEDQDENTYGQGDTIHLAPGASIELTEDVEGLPTGCDWIADEQDDLTWTAPSLDDLEAYLELASSEDGEGFHHVLTANNTLECGDPSIALDKSADETAFVVLEEDGDTSYQVTYTYVVTNDGDLDLDGLTLIDDIVTLGEQVDLTEDLTAALVAEFGSTVLEVGDSVEVQWTTSYDANEDPARIDNTATVSGTDPFGTVVTDSDDESISSTFVGSVTEEKPEEKPEEEPEVAPEVLPEVESVSVVRKVEPKTEVLGVTLPRTGASVLALLISGLLALVAGGSALRRRRSEG